MLYLFLTPKVTDIMAAWAETWWRVEERPRRVRAVEEEAMGQGLAVTRARDCLAVVE